MAVKMSDYVITFLHNGLQGAKCSGFALDDYTIVACAHSDIDPNQFVRHQGAMRTLPRGKISLISEDVMFLTSNYTHGYPVLPHATPCITLQETCYVMPQYSSDSELPDVAVPAKIWAGPTRIEQISKTDDEDVCPMAFPYHFYDTAESHRQNRCFGSSGSPVVNDQGELLGMHIQSDWRDGMGYAIPLFHLLALCRQHAGKF